MIAEVPRDPEDILKDLRAKSKLICHQQRRADEGHFKSVGDAIGLQRLKRDRDRLLLELPPLRLI